MKKKNVLSTMLLLGLSACNSGGAGTSANNLVQTKTNSNMSSTAKVGGAGLVFNAPEGILKDTGGSLYIADTGNHAIEKIDKFGNLSTIAGVKYQSGTTTNGVAIKAHLVAPRSIVKDSNGNIYFADSSQAIVCKVDSSGNLSIIAGIAGHRGTPTPGAATKSKLNKPTSVAVDSNGNVYIADNYTNVIEKIDTKGNLSVIAGTVNRKGIVKNGELATAAKLFGAKAVAVDSNDNVYFADKFQVFKINSNGTLSILGGKFAKRGQPVVGKAINSPLNDIEAVTIDKNGNLYLADSFSSNLLKINTSGNLSIVAGNGTSGAPNKGSLATNSALGVPSALSVDSHGRIYVADSTNNAIEKVASKYIQVNRKHYFEPTFISIPDSASTSGAVGLLDVDSGNIYYSEGNRNGIANDWLGSGSKIQSFNAENHCGYSDWHVLSIGNFKQVTINGTSQDAPCIFLGDNSAAPYCVGNYAQFSGEWGDLMNLALENGYIPGTTKFFDWLNGHGFINLNQNSYWSNKQFGTNVGHYSVNVNEKFEFVNGMGDLQTNGVMLVRKLNNNSSSN